MRQGRGSLTFVKTWTEVQPDLYFSNSQCFWTSMIWILLPVAEVCLLGTSLYYFVNCLKNMFLIALQRNNEEQFEIWSADCPECLSPPGLIHTHPCLRNRSEVARVSSKTKGIDQWRIQDFPDGGHQPLSLGQKPIIWQHFCQNHMTMKDIGSRGRVTLYKWVRHSLMNFIQVYWS